METDNGTHRQSTIRKRILRAVMCSLLLWFWWGELFIRINAYHSVTQALTDTPRGWLPLPFALELGLLAACFLLLLFVMGVRHINPLALIPALALSVILLSKNTYFIPPYERGFYPLSFGQYSTAALALCTAGILYGGWQCLRACTWRMPKLWQAAAFCAVAAAAYLADKVTFPSVMRVMDWHQNAVLPYMILTRTVFPMAAGAIMYLPIAIGAHRSKRCGWAAVAVVAAALLFILIPGAFSAVNNIDNAAVSFLRRMLLGNIGTHVWAILAGAVTAAGVGALMGREETDAL